MAYGTGDEGYSEIEIGNYYSLELTWEIVKQDVKTNSTTFSWDLTFYNNGGYINATYTGEWYVDVDGDNIGDGYKSVAISKGTEKKQLGSGTTTITHEDDGTASFTLGFGWDMGGVNLGGTSYSWVEGEEYVEFVTIPRASDLTVGNGTLGANQTIVANTKASGFQHTLTWQAGSMSGTIASQSYASAWTFAPPLNIAESFPNATQLTMTFTLSTYSSGVQVGSPVSKSVKMTIPDNIAPTCDMTIKDITSYYEELEAYLQTKSMLAISVTATGSYGSNIVRCTITADGISYDSQYAVTDVLHNSGDLPITVTVTDSRGRTAIKTEYIYVQPYDAPRITHLSVRRCDADGSDNMSGQYCNAVYSFSVSSASSSTPFLRYKKTDDINYLYITLQPGQSADRASVVFPADDGYAYNVELVISDAFGSAVRKTLLSTAYAIMHFPASGKGITIGGVATSDGFRCNMDAHFANGLTYTMTDNDDGDCDLFNISGTYYIGIHALNRPLSSAGFLTVKASPDGRFVNQQYVATNGDTYTRMATDSTWGSWQSTLNTAYPVGAIYITTNATNPSTILGGTWDLIEGGRFLLSAGGGYESGRTGGAESVALTVAELPSHSHGQRMAGGLMVDEDCSGEIKNGTVAEAVDEWYDSYEPQVYTDTTGGGLAHNNMPPYLVVYMWVRTA